jgi:Holliday junction resolvase-like predicted endonuclease
MTQAEYLAYEDRRSSRRRESAQDGVEVESDLHAQIFDYVRSKGWIAFHGSMAERTHRTEGEPDFIILADGGKMIMVECKSRSGKLSNAQQAIAVHAEKLGHRVYMVRSLQEFLGAVNHALNLK